MNYKNIIIFLCFIQLTAPSWARAGVVFTEIMYDLDGADIDWVEIYNPDSVDIDITSLKLLVSNSTSNHGIISYSGSPSISSGEYGVIVNGSVVTNFTSKWGSTGNIFTASFTLPNTEGKVEMNGGDKNLPIDSVLYQGSSGANGDGNSLQKDSSGNWVASLPTPGSGSQQAPPQENTNTPVGENIPQNSPSSSISNWPAEPQVFANAGKDKTVIVGAAVLFEGKALGLKKEPLDNARYLWNFGDGEIGEGKTTEHTYHYPGDYMVVLDVASGYFSGSDTAKIHAEPSPLSISSIKDDTSYFIEISNSSKSDIDISSWILSLGGKTFIIPKNTFVIGGKKLVFVNEITGLEVKEGSIPELLYPNGALAYRFGEKEKIVVPEKAEVTQKTTEIKNISASNVSSYSPTPKNEDKLISSQSAIAAEASKSLPNNYIWLFGVAGISVIALSGIFFARRFEQPEDELEKLAREIEIIED